jgi:hypothetical protein
MSAKVDKLLYCQNTIKFSLGRLVQENMIITTKIRSLSYGCSTKCWCGWRWRKSPIFRSIIHVIHVFRFTLFENFSKQNGIKHYKSAPFHPATNGLVERFVQTFKNSMRAMKQDNKVLSHKIANFLLNYMNKLHSVTKETPARLFCGLFPCSHER